MRSPEQKLFAKHRIRSQALRLLSQNYGLNLKKDQVTLSVTREDDEIWVWTCFGNEIIPLVVGSELTLKKRQRRVVEEILNAKYAS